MKKNIIFSLIMLLCVVSCAAPSAENTKWEPFSNSENITCDLGKDSSVMSFISNLGKKTYKTDAAPDSIISITAEPQSEKNFIVNKKLQRYIRSLGDYSTLSQLKIYMEFEEKNGKLVVRPVKKSEHQVSLIGSWPIPKMEMSELVAYLGGNCHIPTYGAQAEKSDSLKHIIPSDNSYVLDRQGHIKTSPLFHKLQSDAIKQQHFNLNMTALVAEHNGTSGSSDVFAGEFKQACILVPAKVFVNPVSSTSSKTELTEEQEFQLWLYSTVRFITEKQGFSPQSIIYCAVNETDRDHWRGLLSFPDSPLPGSLRDYFTAGGDRFYHLITLTQSIFFF